jgi:hypothetical protein
MQQQPQGLNLNVNGKPVNITFNGGGGGGGLFRRQNTAPVAQAVMMAEGGLIRYHLHLTAKVTAEHHVLMGGPSGREFP